MLYRHEYKSDRFAIYSDLSPDFLRRIGPEVEEIFRGYDDLFQLPTHKLGHTTIILRGEARDQEVVDLGYSPSLLGYYIPFLNLISVDTKPAWTRERAMLKQILLHEIAHHFIVTEYPAASKECWLNEGLAGNLEVTLFEEGRFEYPLLNPVLLGIARHSILVDPGAGDLKKLLSLGWSEFHGDGNKELDYALAWALVYYLLEHSLSPEIPLGERINMLYRMDRSLIASLEPGWLEFIRGFDLTGELVRMARAQSPHAPRGKLTPRWAARQLGALKFLDGTRVAPALVELLDSPDAGLRVQASLSFLKVLSRDPDPARESSILRRGRESIVALLLDRTQPLGIREALTEAVGDLLRADPSWVPVLVGLLEAPEGQVRAAAAQGLSTSAMKPMIVNPAFWRNGDVVARTAEVNEWREFWATHREEQLGALD